MIRSTGMNIIALLLISLSACGQRINLPEPARVTLPNGVKIILLEYHRAPTLSVTATFPGGSVTDPKDKSGACDLMAEMMRRGAGSRNAEQIAEEIEFIGGSLDATASSERVSVGLSCLEKDADVGLDLLADIIRRPTFPADELERSRKLALAGLQALPDDPAALAGRLESETLYAGHPYGISPTQSSLTEITAADIKASWTRNIVPDRMILVAVGDFQSSAMLSKLTAIFQDWPRSGSTQPALPRLSAMIPKIVLLDKPDAVQAQIRFVSSGFPMNDPALFPARVANDILGGGFSSRLVKAVRINKSLTYDIGSGFIAQKDAGMFTISTFTKLETIRSLIDTTRETIIKSMAQGFTPAEVAQSKSYRVGAFAIHSQTPEFLGGILGDMEFYGLPGDYLKTWPARIQSVSISQANDIAKRFFDPSRMSLIIVAPAKKVGNQLNGLGNVETRTIRPWLSGSVKAATPDKAEAKDTRMEITDDIKQKIDAWIKAKGLNTFGDPPGTMYTGGTPLFNEMTGERKDRYDYILGKHPELAK